MTVADSFEYRPLIEWGSTREIAPPHLNVSYSVVRYGRWLRKQACLVEHSKTAQRPIAWFPNEQDAIDFCDVVLGGIQRAVKA